MLVGAMKTDLLFIFTNNYGYNALYNYSCKKIAEIIEELDNAALEPHFQVLAWVSLTWFLSSATKGTLIMFFLQTTQAKHSGWKEAFKYYIAL